MNKSFVNCVKIYLAKPHLRVFSSNSAGTPVEKTSLYDFHVANNGKMVDFAGYLLPVQYSKLGIAASHLHTRLHASVFDVSHMLQTYMRGKDVIECFEQLCTADIHGLADNSGTLTVFTNQKGGILDDLIVTKIKSNLLYVVSNAARKEHDAHLIQNAVDAFRAKGKDVHVQFLTPSEQALIAVQGPKAVAAVQNVCDVSLDKLYFMQTAVGSITGVPNCRITRCGYTGEDGVEISIPADKAAVIVKSLLTSKIAQVELAGLGARDSLRLEAGLCLYGNDIDETTTPIEAGLAWLVAKRRRAAVDFPGANHILDQLKNGTVRRRIGFRMPTKGPPARHGTEVFATSADDKKSIGHITSGCPSPSLGGNIAIGYVLDGYKRSGTELQLKIRDKMYSAVSSAMPFTPAHYFNQKK